MVVKIIQENETKSFWTFKEVGHDTRPYDVLKSQMASAFRNLELWQNNPGASNFSAKLYNLMAKADPENFRKIFNGFPVRTTAYCLWYHTVNKEELEKYFRGDDGRNQL